VSPGCCHGQLASEWQRHGDWQAGRLAGDSEVEPLAGHGSRVYDVTPLALASELRVLGGRSGESDLLLNGGFTSQRRDFYERLATRRDSAF
jgi:hypothetical protein